MTRPDAWLDPDSTDLTGRCGPVFKTMFATLMLEDNCYLDGKKNWMSTIFG